MDLVEALATSGAVRDFDPEPIDDATVARILSIARFAPSGGNRQGWRVVVVKDRGVRAEIGDLYRAGWREYLAQARVGLVPWAPVTDREAERRALADLPPGGTGGPGDFAARFDTVPVMLVLLADLTALAAVDRDLHRYTFAGGASVYPFAWSILLAARSEGVAGVMTTMVIRREDSVRALLHVPADQAVAAVIALGRPARQSSRLRRTPVEGFATVDYADGPALAGGADGPALAGGRSADGGGGRS